ncbi:MAG TPA: hypothetical protein VNQ72_10265, partial [Candidatus Dormibacteraeota bacterium]|nr:hypothetical protein [Candidatus Dormibacteraeota bacterium]
LSDAGLQFIAWILAIVLYTIAYLRLPHQPRYLIPMLPFVILVLNRILDRRVFVFVCSILIASSFLSIGRTGVHPGPMFSDHAARRRALEFVERVIPRANALQGKAVIVAGPWLYMIWGVLLKRPHGVAEYVDVLDASDLRRRLGRGWAVYYLPEMRNYNRAVTGIDLAISGAEPLLAFEVTDFGVE